MITALAYLAVCQIKPGTAKIVKPAAAIYADAATRKAVTSCRNAYAKLQSAKFSIGQGQSLKRYTYANGYLAGAQEGVQWTFGGMRLTLKTSKGLYQGKVGPANINPWLSKAGAQPEMLPIQLAAKRNPMDVLIPPASRIRKAGVMKIAGVDADLIEIKSPGLRVSVAIRRDNHLIADLGAENVDRRGNVLFRSSRSINWSQVNKPVPATTFQIAGTKKPLKSL